MNSDIGLLGIWNRIATKLDDLSATICSRRSHAFDRKSVSAVRSDESRRMAPRVR